MRNQYSLLVFFLLVFSCSHFSNGVFAAEHGHGTDHDKAPHNGQFVAVGEYHLEMLAKDNELSIYVTDHGWKPKDVTGATGKVWILSNNKKTELSLQAGQKNLMTAKGEFKSSDKMKVVLKLSMPNQKPVTARFTPKNK